jgi:hypothetical protein
MAPTNFQIAVLSIDGEQKEELLVGAIDPFSSGLFKTRIQQCILEMAYGAKLVDEKRRKLVIEIELDSYNELVHNVENLHSDLKYGFNFEFIHPKVVHCEVSSSAGFGEKAKVNCIFSDGSSKVVFDFFDDEISFRADEFIGLTSAQCLEVFTRKDIAYLRS